VSETLDAQRAELHAPFRSRRGRLVGWIAAAGQGVVLLAAAALLPWSGPNTVGWYDRLGFIVVAALIGYGLHRLASVSAIPSETGLVVRNVLLTRRLDWAELVGIHFGSGDPWVLLDVSDGDSLAVMAIQRADGTFAASEAKRLATLMALHAPRRP
jgi:hypothetical protein